MKIKIKNRKKIFSVLLLKKSVVTTAFLYLSICTASLKAQLCTNPKDSVYTLTTSGELHSLNINNGAASGILGGTAVASASNSNGFGFSSLTGKFYFFNHCAIGDFIEFVSYDPVTKTKQVLASPPAPITLTDKIRSGTVNNAGTGYYTLLPSSPATAATFYYYDIGANTWKIIAQSFKDTATGNSVDSMFHNLNSGDMAFDGAGNLWIICSKNPKYALYKVQAPVRTTAVAKLAVTIVIPTRSMPIATSAASFTGVAFNSQGKLFMTTGSNSSLGVGVSTPNTNYNILYRMTSSSPLVIDSIASIPNSYGDDLTSCFYSVGVLSSRFYSFMASLQKNVVQLSWKVNETNEVTGYNIEYSPDAEYWQTIGYKEKGSETGLQTYHFTDANHVQGRNYFRIVQITTTDKKNTSEIRMIDTRSVGKITIGPNPVSDVIYLYNKENSSNLQAKVFDTYGRLIYSTIITPERQSINVSSLPKGQFILKLYVNGSSEDSPGYHFIKW
jgi:hypothetical protein